MEARPQRSGITRSRAGCANCRQQKRKCDEVRPSCGRCVRQGVVCPGYVTAIRFHDQTEPTQLRHSRQRPPPEPSPQIVHPPLCLRSCPPEDHHALHCERTHHYKRLCRPAQASYGSQASQARTDRTDKTAPPIEAHEYLTDVDTDSPPQYHPPSSSRQNNGTRNAAVAARILHTGNSIIPPPQRSLEVPYSLPIIDRSYLAHFTGHVVQTLPAGLQEVLPDLLQNAAVRHAALALSSSNLGALRGGGVLALPRGHSTIPGASSSDMTRSAHHMVRAISAIRPGEINDATALFATIIFLAYYEMEAGTVHGVATHVKGFNTLLLQHGGAMFSTLALTRPGRRLLRTWVMLRSRVMMWFSVATSLDVESPIESRLTNFCLRVAGFRERVQLLLAQAISTTMRIIFSASLRIGYEDARETMAKASDWYTVMRDGVDPGTEIPDHPLTTDECMARLSSLKSEAIALTGRDSQMLGDPESAGAVIPPHYSCELQRLHGIAPLTFSDHNYAMAQASLALAHLVCDRHSLSNFLNGNRTAFETLTNPWAIRILAIAEGLDTATCAFRNTYNGGIMSILFFLAILYPNRSVIAYIREQFLPRLQSHGQCREDACGPLNIDRSIFDRLWYEVVERSGTVLMLSPLLDQTAEKAQYYDNGEGIWLLMHRRDANGAIINECVLNY